MARRPSLAVIKLSQHGAAARFLAQSSHSLTHLRRRPSPLLTSHDMSRATSGRLTFARAPAHHHRLLLKIIATQRAGPGLSLRDGPRTGQAPRQSAAESLQPSTGRVPGSSRPGGRTHSPSPTTLDHRTS